MESEPLSVICRRSATCDTNPNGSKDESEAEVCDYKDNDRDMVPMRTSSMREQILVRPVTGSAWRERLNASIQPCNLLNQPGGFGRSEPA